jgi:hypothetical protein
MRKTTFLFEATLYDRAQFIRQEEKPKIEIKSSKQKTLAFTLVLGSKG